MPKLNYKLLFKATILLTALSGGLWLINYYSRPVLKVKFLNHYPSPGSNSFPKIIESIIKEKYRVIAHDKDYDLIFDDPYDKDDIHSPEIDKNAIKFFYTPEPVKPIIDNYDLSIGFDHIDDPRYIRVPYSYFRRKFSSNISTRYKRDKHLGQCTPAKKEFACFLVSNGSKVNTRNNTPLDGIAARISIFNTSITI